jgi:hypothetical protein
VLDALAAGAAAPVDWEGEVVVVTGWDAGVGDGWDGCSASVEEAVARFGDGDGFEPVLSAVAVVVA